MEYRELAATTGFQELFVSGMIFTSARDLKMGFVTSPHGLIEQFYLLPGGRLFHLSRQ